MDSGYFVSEEQNLLQLIKITIKIYKKHFLLLSCCFKMMLVWISKNTYKAKPATKLYKLNKELFQIWTVCILGLIWEVSRNSVAPVFPKNEDFCN